MKNLFLAILIALPFQVFAAEGDMGVGVMLGNPTGISGKYWLSGNHAIDAGAGMSFGPHTNFNLHSDYLLQVDGAFYFMDEHLLDFYYGIGGRMEFADDIELGIRLPVGLAHKFEETSDMFAEIAPIIDFVSRTGVELSLGIGARYYFH